MAEQPRAWSADEVAIAEMVASQTRFVSEAARLLAAERDRTEREQLSNRIGSSLRSTLDPFKIQQDATRELGVALEGGPLLLRAVRFRCPHGHGRSRLHEAGRGSD